MDQHVAAPSSKSVLLVGLDEDSRQRIELPLQMHGYRIVEAQDDASALDAVETYDPDAIVTTFTVAEDESTLAQQIRERPFGAFSTIVGLTPDAVTPARRAEGEEAGYDLLVSIPLLPWSFATRVDQVVRASRELRALSREALGAQRRIPEAPERDRTAGATRPKPDASRAAVLTAASRIVRDFLPSAGTNIISVDALASALGVRREVCHGAIDELVGLGFFERRQDGTYIRVNDNMGRRSTDKR